MFCDAYTHYTEYELTLPNGDVADNRVFGLHRTYDGNPVGVGVGRLPSKTFVNFGEILPTAQLYDHVREVLTLQFPQLPYVIVTVREYGAIDPTGFGLRHEHKLRVDR